jgi:hypothetical protein
VTANGRPDCHPALALLTENRKFWSAAPALLPDTSAELNHLLGQAKECAAYFKRLAAEQTELAIGLDGIIKGKIGEEDGAREIIERAERMRDAPATARTVIEFPTTGPNTYFSESDRQQHRGLFRRTLRCFWLMKRCKTHEKGLIVSQRVMGAKAQISNGMHLLYEGMQNRIVAAMASLEKHQLDGDERNAADAQERTAKKSNRRQSWPPDAGWHFREGEYAFAWRKAPIRGKPSILLKLLASSAGPVSRAIITARLWPRGDAPLGVEEAIRQHLLKVRNNLKCRFSLSDAADPIPHVDFGAQTAWRIDEKALKSRPKTRKRKITQKSRARRA